MLGLIEIAWWHWVGFLAVVLVLLGLDLGVFHRRAHRVGFKEAVLWTAAWCGFALGFALLLWWRRGEEDSLDFLTGYLIELSLSMDNVFVMVLIFDYFAVATEYQHRVLFWGVLGALVMRGLMIWLGAELIRGYAWMLYVFGVFLVLSGIKMLVLEEEEVHPRRNPVLRLAQTYLPVAPETTSQAFVTRLHGRWALTPLALVLLMVETTDLVFALDSIPAIFAVTTKTFIVFTSNIFAILGLRSLYFVLAGAIGYFRYLKYGVALVLTFIGFKMLIADWVHLPSQWALGVVATLILLSMAASVLTARGLARTRKGP